MKGLLDQLTRDLLRRVVYGSLVGAAAVWLLTTSSPWKAAGVVIMHVEASVAIALQAWLKGNHSLTDAKVVTVVIDDEVYAQRFGSRSPLDRSQLQALVGEILTHTPASTRVAVDLDVSPLPPKDGPQNLRLDGLDALWLQHRERVVLIRPEPEPTGTVQAWLGLLEGSHCRVEFASPAIPEVFGLVDMAHDAAGSLGQRAAAPRKTQGCDAVSAGSKDPGLSRQGMNVASLSSPLVLSAEPGIGPVLAQLQPRVVVVGGTWGHADTFLTPVGRRHGVHLHAARASGTLAGHSSAAPWVQVLVAIVTASLLVASARVLARRLSRPELIPVEVHPLAADPSGPSPDVTHGVLRPSADLQRLYRQHPSQVFMHGAARRLLVLAWVLGLFVLLVVVAAALRVWAGYWIPMTVALGFALFSVTAAWVGDITASLQADAPTRTLKVLPARTSGAEHLAKGTPITWPIRLADDPGPPPSPWSETREKLAVIAHEFKTHARALCERHPPNPGGRRAALWHLSGIVLHVMGRSVLPAMALIYLLNT